MHPSGGAPDPIAFGREVCAWLEVDTPTAPPLIGTYSVIAVGDGLWAVPDAAIDEPLRRALDAPWHRTFAIEEIVLPGPLWLLLCTGLGDAHAYAWIGPTVGITAEQIARAHRAWDAYSIAPAALVGARISHLYSARLAD